MHGEGPEDESGEPPRPTSPPGERLLRYFLACVAATFAGLALAWVAAAAWSAARLGEIASGSPQFEQALTISGFLTTYPLLAGVTLYFARRVDQGTLSRIGLTRQGIGRGLMLGAAVGALFVGAGTTLYVALGWERLVRLPGEPGMLLLAAVVLYPLIGFTEELIFRGYLLTNLEEWLGRGGATAVTAVLFWVVHLGQGNVGEPLGALSFVATGVTLALARYGTGGLWFPIGLHAAYDWAAVTLTGGAGMALPALAQTHVSAPAWLVGPPGAVGLADLLQTLLLLGGVYWLLYRRARAGPFPNG